MFEWLAAAIVVLLLVAALLSYLELYDTLDLLRGAVGIVVALFALLAAGIAWAFTKMRRERTKPGG